MKYCDVGIYSKFEKSRAAKKLSLYQAILIPILKIVRINYTTCGNNIL